MICIDDNTNDIIFTQKLYSRLEDVIVLRDLIVKGMCTRSGEYTNDTGLVYNDIDISIKLSTFILSERKSYCIDFFSTKYMKMDYFKFTIINDYIYEFDDKSDKFRKADYTKLIAVNYELTVLNDFISGISYIKLNDNLSIDNFDNLLKNGTKYVINNIKYGNEFIYTLSKLQYNLSANNKNKIIGLNKHQKYLVEYYRTTIKYSCNKDIYIYSLGSFGKRDKYKYNIIVYTLFKKNTEHAALSIPIILALGVYSVPTLDPVIDSKKYKYPFKIISIDRNKYLSMI